MTAATDPVRIAATWNVIWNGHEQPPWRQPVSERHDAGMFETSVHNAVDRLVWSDAHGFYLSAIFGDWLPRCEATRGVYLTVRLEAPNLQEIDERLWSLIPTARDTAWAKQMKLVGYERSWRERAEHCRLEAQLV